MTADIYRDIIDKVQKRLSGWKAKQLSFAGRLTLIKSVLTSLPTYAMQTVVLPASICDQLDRLNRSFLWGDTEQSRRVHLVNWKDVCKGKEDGGLGIRGARNANGAFAAKLGWRFLTEPSSLLSRVLQGKYCKNNSILLRYKQVASSAWKGIVRSNELIQRCAKWKIGNGCLVRFWWDNWLLGEPLNLYATRSLSQDEQDAKVGDYWVQGVGWNWPILQSCLPIQLCKTLAAMVLCPGDHNPDRLVWGDATDGSFSVKAAYKALKTHPGNRESDPWSKKLHGLWKVKVPERVRCFLWQVAKGRILTNSERWRRGLSQSSECSLCSGGDETVLHLLRDCGVAKKVWCSLVSPSQRSQFFAATFLDWFTDNLYGDKGVASNSSITGWASLFAISCWWIWRWRNEWVLAGKAMNDYPDYFLLWQFGEINLGLSKSPLQIQSTQPQNFLVSWCPPVADWIALNTDGAVRGHQSLATAGGVLRDLNGVWLGGFAHNIGICLVLSAELWGILDGLEMAPNCGFRKIYLQVDSMVALQCIQRGVTSSHPQANLIQNCRDIIARDWSVKLHHIHREGNMVADRWQAMLLRYHGGSTFSMSRQLQLIFSYGKM